MFHFTYSGSGSLEWGSFAFPSAVVLAERGSRSKDTFLFIYDFFQIIIKSFKYLIKNYQKRENTVFCLRDTAQMSDTTFK